MICRFFLFHLNENDFRHIYFAVEKYFYTMTDTHNGLRNFWSLPPEKVFALLGSDADGISTSTAAAKLTNTGGKEFRKKNVLPGLRLFIAQFKSPLVLLLLFAVILSAVLGEYREA